MESFPIPKTMQKSKKTNWAQLTFYISSDCPSQITLKNRLSGNCGIHLCTWAYIIDTGSATNFEESQMSNLRKSIAQILYEVPEDDKNMKVSKSVLNSLFQTLKIIQKNTKK